VKRAQGLRPRAHGSLEVRTRVDTSGHSCISCKSQESGLEEDMEEMRADAQGKKQTVQGRECCGQPYGTWGRHTPTHPRKRYRTFDNSCSLL
jgi:hypothetical protein